MQLPSLVAAGLGPVCGSAHCRVLIDRRPGMSEQAFRHLVAQRLRHRRERREFDAKAALRLAVKRDLEAQENQAVWDSTDLGSGRFLPTRHVRVVLPSGPRRLSPLPQRRRNLYRDHLNRIIADAAPRVAAFADQATDSTSVRTADSGTGALCSLCRGGCCTQGGNEAYLTEATVLRFMSRNRELRPRDVLAAYLERLGSRTEAYSCVNHGALGCTLPREMRSDTCNNYFCDSIATWRDQSATAPSADGTLVILRRQDVWRRNLPDTANDIIGLHLVSERGSTELPLKGVPAVES
jgi:hypothetical protein